MAFILLMNLSILMLGLIVVKFAEKRMMEEEKGRLEILADSIENMGSFIPLKDLDLQRIVDIYSKKYRIKEIFFVDDNSRILAHNKKGLVGKYYKPEGNPPIISRSIKGIGRVYIRPSSKKGFPISEKFLLLYLIFNSLILVVLGSFIISRLVVKPIDRLREITRKIADGDLTQRVPVAYQNEIGSLAESFNKMVDSLKESIKIREDQLEELNRINEELREAQEEMIKAEKLAMVGRIAAGVAHEIGNPLNIILGYIALIKKTRDKTKMEDYLKKIENEVNRINKIVRDLLDLSRPPKLIQAETDINEVLRNCADLLSHELRKKEIKLELNLTPYPLKIKIDGERFKQVIINLLINSIDAVDKGGKIEISTESSIFSKKRLKTSKFKEGDRILIVSVADNGRGISEENLKRIFEPFFTTKATTKGTGLGLTISQRIIESFGGDILVESKEGAGTTFRIILGMG